MPFTSDALESGPISKGACIDEERVVVMLPTILVIAVVTEIAWWVMRHCASGRLSR
ncbi:MAG TPA: hypothetical protein VF814_01680 [Casimicrobiaceae bacterium]